MKLDFDYPISGYAYSESEKEPTAFQGNAQGSTVKYYIGSGTDILVLNLDFDGKRIGFGNGLYHDSDYLCTTISDFTGPASGEDDCGWAIGKLDQSVILMEFELDGQKQMLLLSKTGLSEAQIRQELREVFRRYPEWKANFTLFE